jgi:hypothetical protein
MKTSRLVLIVGSVAAALVAAGLATGLLRFPHAGDSRPPCDQLPTREQADRALRSHSALKDRILSDAKGVSVHVSMPCDGQDRALIRVSYSQDSQREAVQTALLDGGFGVPVELVRSS